MSYRNPGQLVTKYNPTEGITKPSSIEQPNYSEIARKNAKANFDIIRSNDINAQKAFADQSKVVKEKPYINQSSANNILSTTIDETAAAKSRLETATSYYEKRDSTTGDVLYSYDSDLKILANNQAFLNGFTQDLNAINYMTETFDKAGGFGKGEGQVDTKFTSPYFTLLRSVQDPFAEGINVEYIKEKDANGVPSMGIKLYGSRVAEVNKIQGNEGDSYVIKPGELQKIFNNQDGDPSFEGLFYKNHTAVGNIKKQTESMGLINPKTGLISDQYRVDGGITTKTNKVGGYTEQISASVINKDKVNQMLSPIIKTQANSIMRRGNTSTDVAINQYTQQDEDGNYYYNPVVWDDVNNKFSIDKQNQVNLGKDFFDRNLTEENQKTFGYTQEQYNHIVEILKSNVYQDLGFTQQPQQTVIQGTRKDIPKQATPTEGQIKRTEAIKITGDIMERFSALGDSTDEVKKGFVTSTLTGFLNGGNVSFSDDDKQVFIEGYDKIDKKGNIITSQDKAVINIGDLSTNQGKKDIMQQILNLAGYDISGPTAFDEFNKMDVPGYDSIPGTETPFAKDFKTIMGEILVNNEIPKVDDDIPSEINKLYPKLKVEDFYWGEGIQIGYGGKEIEIPLDKNFEYNLEKALKDYEEFKIAQDEIQSTESVIKEKDASQFNN